MPIPAEPKPAPPWKATAAALAVYGLLAVVATWPLALHLGDSVWVGRFDVWITLWLLGWLSTSVWTGTLSPWCAAVFHPLGKSTLVFGHLGYQFLAVPLVPLVGLTASYNLLLLGALAGSAWGAFLLIREVTEDAGAALAGGALFGFCPLLLLEAGVGSLENTFAAFLPLTLFFLVRLKRRGRWQDALLAGLCTAAGAMVSWYYGIFLALAGGLFVLFHGLRDGRPDLRFLKGCAQAVVLCLGLVLPLALLVYPEVGRSRLPLSPALLETSVVNELMDFVDGRIPLAELSPDRLDRMAAAEVYFNSYSPSEQWRPGRPTEPINARVSILLLQLGLVGFFTAGRAGLYWAVLAAVFWVLSLGPAVRMGGDFVHGYLAEQKLPYYYLYNASEVLRQAFRPYRFLAMTELALAVLAAFGVAWMARRLARRPGLQPVFYGGVLVVVAACRWLLPDHPPVHLQSTAPPERYRQLARDREDYAMVELPFYPIPATPPQTRYVYYQAIHGKPVLNDHFVRTSELLRLRALALDNSLLLTWLELDSNPDAWPPQIRPEDVDWWVRHGFRYANVHTTFEPDPGSEDRQMALEGIWSVLVLLFGPARSGGEGLQFFEFSPVGAGPTVDEAGYLAKWPAKPYRLVMESLMSNPERHSVAETEVVEPDAPLAGISFWIRVPPGQEEPLSATLQGESTANDWVLPVVPDRWNWIHLREPQGPLAGPGTRLLLQLRLPGAEVEIRRLVVWSM